MSSEQFRASTSEYNYQVLPPIPRANPEFYIPVLKTVFEHPNITIEYDLGLVPTPELAAERAETYEVGIPRPRRDDVTRIIFWVKGERASIGYGSNNERTLIILDKVRVVSMSNPDLVMLKGTKYTTDEPSAVIISKKTGEIIRRPPKREVAI